MANLRGGIKPYNKSGDRREVMRLASECIKVWASTWSRTVYVVLDKAGRCSISVNDEEGSVINMELPCNEGKFKDAFAPMIKYKGVDVYPALVAEQLKM